MSVRIISLFKVKNIDDIASNYMSAYTSTTNHVANFRYDPSKKLQLGHVFLRHFSIANPQLRRNFVHRNFEAVECDRLLRRPQGPQGAPGTSKEA